MHDPHVPHSDRSQDCVILPFVAPKKQTQKENHDHKEGDALALITLALIDDGTKLDHDKLIEILQASSEFIIADAEVIISELHLKGADIARHKASINAANDNQQSEDS